MTKPKDHKKAPQIRVLIIRWFEMFNVGDQFLTDDVCRYVSRYMTVKSERDSVRRYMRQLRQRGQIHYTCIHKESRIIKVIAPGEPHSL